MSSLAFVFPTLVGVGSLMVLTVGVLSAARAPHPFAAATAVVRGLVQLAVISLVLAGVIRNGLWVGVALLVMFAVATITATRRLGWSAEHLLLVVAGMGLGIAVILVVVFGTGAIAFSSRYVLAIGGIVVGNAMSIATLSGRRMLEAVGEQWEQVEAWLAIGATPRESTRALAHRSVYSALIPSIDQTRTTGLVTLPGAFVGAIFGGVSPLEAGRFQIVVLAAIMATGAITAAVVVRGLAAVRTRPAAPR